MEGLASFLLIGALLSPLFGLGAAVHYYLSYRDAPEPKRRPSTMLYALGIVAAAVIPFPIGIFAGIEVACGIPNAGNLCGLWGYFIAGPLFSTVTMVLFARYWARHATQAP